MAKRDTRTHPGVPAKNGGNRTQPAIANKLPQPPPDYKNTYGAGNGAGGNGVPAKDGGNRKSPAIANKIPLPSQHDTYSGTGGK